MIFKWMSGKHFSVKLSSTRLVYKILCLIRSCGIQFHRKLYNFKIVYFISFPYIDIGM